MKVAFSTADFLDRAASVYPLRTGVVDEPGPHQDGGLGSVTYGGLAERAAAIAAGLDALGTVPGDRVAVVSHNSARLLELFFGVTAWGRVLVPVNFRLSRDEVAYIVEHSGASVLLVDPEGCPGMEGGGDLFSVSRKRTALQDLRFPIDELVEIAARALSPGVNDPTTALDAMLHLGAVLFERLIEDPPHVAYLGDDGRRIELAHVVDDEELTGIAFDELRAASADNATVSIYVLDVLHTLSEGLELRGRFGAVALLGRHAARLMASVEERQPDPAERDRVRAAYERRFRAAT